MLDYINKQLPNSKINRLPITPIVNKKDNSIGKILNGGAYYTSKIGTGFLKGAEGISDLLGTAIGHGASGIQGLWDKEGAKKTKDFWEKTVEQKTIDSTLGKAVNETYGKNAEIDNNNDIVGNVIEGVGEMVPSILLGNAVVGGVSKVTGLATKGTNLLQKGQLATQTVEKLARGTQTAKNTAKLISATNTVNKLNKTAKLLNVADKSINSTAGMLPFMANAIGKNTEQALNEGADFDSATKYGLSSGGVETGIELLSGGIGGIQLTKKAITNPTFRKVALEVGKDILGEGFEEGLSAIVDPYLKRTTYNKEAQNATIKEVGEQAVMGMLSAVLLKGSTKGIQSANNVVNKLQNNKPVSTQETTKAIQDIKEAGIDVNNIQTNEMQSNLEQTQSSKQISPLPTKVAQNGNMEQITPKLPIYSFSKQVDDAISGKYPKRDMLTLGRTPRVLKELGLPDLPITMTQKHLDTIMNESGSDKNANYHGLGIDIVKKLPEAINNPLDIVKSNTKDDSIVLTTDLSDKQDRTIIASVKINGKGLVNKILIDTNIMTSAYGRNNYDKFMENNIKNGNLLYDIDNGVIKKPNIVGKSFSPTSNDSAKIVTPRLQLPNANNQVKVDRLQLPVSNNSINNSIAQNNTTVNNKYMQNEQKNTQILPIKSSLQNKKQSNFYNSTLNSQVLNKEAKALIKPNEDIKYYEGITNAETFKNSGQRLQNEGQTAITDFFSKDSKNANAEDVALGLQLMKQYQEIGDYKGLVNTAEKLRDMGTKGGQTIQAFSILQRMSPEGMLVYMQRQLDNAKQETVKNKSQNWIDKNKSVIENMNLTEQEAQTIVNKMEEVQNITDKRQKQIKLAEIQKIITDKIPATLGDSFKAYRRIAMLFNPKTQIRNISGNLGVAPINMVGDSTIGTLTDKLISKRTGARTTGITDVKSYTKGFIQGGRQAFQDWRKGINTRDVNVDKFEVGKQGRSFNDKGLGKILNKIDALNSSLLDLGDRPFFQAEFMNSLNNQMKLNNAAKATPQMIEVATETALQRTWQDNNNYTDTVLEIRKGLNKVNIGGVGFGDIVIPFAKTPANLTKALVDYSPVGVINTIIDTYRLDKAYKKGEFSLLMQKKLVDDVSKAFVGSLLYIIAGALASARITSGEADKDKDIANFERNVLGIQPYSVKIGDKSFTYDWAQPLAAPLGIMANVVNKQKEENMLQTIVNAISQGGNMLYEQSFLQNLNRLLSSDDKVKAMFEMVGDIPASLVPTVFKQVGEVIDPTTRTTYKYNDIVGTGVNKVKAKIPFLTKTLQPAVDTTGEEIQKYGGEANLFNIFLNPATVSKRKQNKSAEEIYRLYEKTGDKTIFPRIAPYYDKLNGEKIILKPEEKTQIQKESGIKANKLILDTISNSEYKKLSDNEKVKIVNDLVNYSFGKATNNVIGKELSPENKSLQKYIDNGLQPSNAVVFKNTINNIESKKDNQGNTIDGSSSGQKALKIMNMDISKNEKNAMLSLITTSKTPETLDTLSRLPKTEKDYTNYFAMNKKDAFINIKYSRADVQDIQDLGIKQDVFMQFVDNIGNIKADKDKNGKTITNSLKNKTRAYINSLPLSVNEKVMLFAKAGYPDKQYYNQVKSYINNLNVSVQRKQQLWEGLNYDKVK